MPEHEIVLEPECKALTRLHPTTRWRLEKQGQFPQRFKIGDLNAFNGRIAWSRTEIMEWLAKRMAARKPVTTDDNTPSTEEAWLSSRPTDRKVLLEPRKRGRSRKNATAEQGAA
jgi:predicted DNA-binding transcriptional regulator AlpA